MIRNACACSVPLTNRPGAECRCGQRFGRVGIANFAEARSVHLLREFLLSAVRQPHAALAVRFVPLDDVPDLRAALMVAKTRAVTCAGEAERARAAVNWAWEMTAPAIGTQKDVICRRCAYACAAGVKTWTTRLAIASRVFAA